MSTVTTMYPTLSRLDTTPRRIEERKSTGAFAFLDRIEDGFRTGSVATSLRELMHGLEVMRKAMSVDAWSRFAKVACRNHPLFDLIQEDPMARRSVEQPRGYAGDAELIDYFYGIKEFSQEETVLGRVIGRCTARSPSGESVRERRDILSRKLDELADECDAPRVLSVAAGHLREAQQSQAVREGRIGRIYALDQDAESLALVAREQASNHVKQIPESITALLRDRVALSDLDFVYSAGLYDYLNDKVAKRLTRKMFDLLRPGGRCLVANFATGQSQRAYMEAFFDWWLMHRDESEMLDLLDEIPSAQIDSTRLYRDGPGQVIYMEITKA